MVPDDRVPMPWRRAGRQVPGDKRAALLCVAPDAPLFRCIGAVWCSICHAERAISGSCPERAFPKKGKPFYDEFQRQCWLSRKRSRMPAMVQAPPRVRPRGKGISSNETLGREGWPDVPRSAPRRPVDASGPLPPHFHARRPRGGPQTGFWNPSWRCRTVPQDGKLAPPS